mgnify:CR=1 FL=1
MEAVGAIVVQRRLGHPHRARAEDCLAVLRDPERPDPRERVARERLLQVVVRAEHDAAADELGLRVATDADNDRVLAEQRALGRKVGLIIDLSNHDCLYSDGVPPDLERVHVRNVAKSVPNVECTDEVIAVASEFWSRRPSMQSLYRYGAYS